MKECVEWDPNYSWKDFYLKQVSNLVPLDHQARAEPTELMGLPGCIATATDNATGQMGFGVIKTYVVAPH